MLDPALLPALHDVLTVARRGSVAEAAAHLHKTPSAVSQQIRRLERAFDLTLFERLGRGLRPTAAGEALMEPAARVFDEAEQVGALLTEMAGTSTTTLRIAVSDYLGRELLAPVMRESAEEGASLRFEITTTHSAEAIRVLQRGDADVAVVTGPVTAAGLSERTLFHQEFFWVGPAHADDPRSLEQRLPGEPVLRLAPGSVGRSMLDDYLTGRGLLPVSTIDVPSVSLLLAYAAAGVGIGLAPGLPLRHFAGDTLCAQRASMPALPVKLVQRPRFRSRPPVERFLARLVEQGRAPENSGA